MHRGLVLAALVVLAGCGASVPHATQTEAGTATPAPVPTDPTPEPELYPPGLTADTVVADRLATVTAQSVRNTAFAFRIDRRVVHPERSLGTVYRGTRLEVRAASVSRYLLTYTAVTERGGGIAVETFQNATYVRGERATAKVGDEVTVRPVELSERTPPATRVGELVRRYLTVENATVERLTNGSAVVQGRGTSLPNASQYSVTAVVAADGTVTRFDAVFTRNDRVRFVRFRLDRNATFEPPDWTDDVTG